ncbi:MAG: GDP-L-fucose synthase [Chlamydiales bacterium]
MNQMPLHAPIYIAGHNGLVGSAVLRRLKELGYHNLITKFSSELDLTDYIQTKHFFETYQPEYIFLCAARVGGILANASFPATFIYDNLMIQSHVIHLAKEYGAKRLLFLGSSCIYPRNTPQPITEDAFLTGALERTNEPYAIAKIAGIEMCWAYNRQHQCAFLPVMPTNLYGPNDNYDAHSSHVLPAFIHKFHHAKKNEQNELVLWGTGTAKREFLYSDDLANAVITLMNLPENFYRELILSDNHRPLINIGTGIDISIKDLALIVADIVGYKGKIFWDSSKPDGTPRKLLDISLINRFGWSPRIELKEGISLSYQDYLSRTKVQKLKV